MVFLRMNFFKKFGDLGGHFFRHLGYERSALKYLSPSADGLIIEY
jgi:hypothetical protein